MNILDIPSSPSLLRSYPGHTGTSSLTNSFQNKVTSNGSEKEKKEGSFESFLLDAVNSVNSHQLEVGKVQEKLITDPDSVDVHDVTIAMGKAQMSLSLAQNVIERLLSGWNEIQMNR